MSGTWMLVPRRPGFINWKLHKKTTHYIPKSQFQADDSEPRQIYQQAYRGGEEKNWKEGQKGSEFSDQRSLKKA